MISPFLCLTSIALYVFICSNIITALLNIHILLVYNNYGKYEAN